MIELFSNRPSFMDSEFNKSLSPIYLDDSVASLSAILLNDDYYEILKGEKRTIDGCSVITIQTVVLFKMKAWLDLNERRSLGERIDEWNVKKHKNDVLRLVASVPPSRKINVTDEIHEDISKFIEGLSLEKTDMKSLGLRGVELSEVIQTIRNMYI